MDKVPLSVRLKALDRGEKTVDLCLTLKRETTPSLHQQLHLEITDETDAFFLYSLSIGESDFHVLKSEQRLVVDFQTFPEKLLEMLRDVPNRLYASLCVQSPQEAQFALVESNQFRELPHLSLKFRKGNDEALKDYMSTKLTEFKTNNELLTKRAIQAEDENTRLRQRCEEYDITLRRIREEQKTITDTLHSKHAIELGGLKEEQASRLETIQRQNLLERTSMEQNLRSKVDELNARLQKHEADIHILTQEKYQLETSEARNKETIAKQAANLTENDAEVNNLRTQCKSLESTKYQLEKQVTELEWNVKLLGEKIAERENLTLNQAELNQQTQVQTASMEETIAVYKQQVQQGEEKFQYCVAEIEKGNAYIKKLTDQVHNLKSSLGSKKTQIKELKQTLDDTEKSISEEKRLAESFQSDLREGQNREENRQREIETLNKNLNEAREMIKNNQQVIDYLNKQLTERDLKTFAPLQLGGHENSTASATTMGIASKPRSPTLPLGALSNPIGEHGSSVLHNNLSYISTTPTGSNANNSFYKPLDQDASARKARVDALLANSGRGNTNRMPATGTQSLSARRQQSDGIGAAAGGSSSYNLSQVCSAVPRNPPQPYGSIHPSGTSNPNSADVIHYQRPSPLVS